MSVASRWIVCGAGSIGGLWGFALAKNALVEVVLLGRVKLLFFSFHFSFLFSFISDMWPPHFFFFLFLFSSFSFFLI